MDAFQFRKLPAAPAAGDQIAVYLTGTQSLVPGLVDLVGQPLANPFVIADADHWGFRPVLPATVDVWWVEGATMLVVGESLDGVETTMLTLADATFDGRYLSLPLPSPVAEDKEVVVEFSTDAIYFTVMGISGNIAVFFFFGARRGLFRELHVIHDPTAAGVVAAWDADNNLIVRCQASATAQAVIDAIVAATSCEYHLQDLEQQGYDPATTSWLDAGLYHWYPDGPGSRWIDDNDHDAGVVNELHQITPDGLMTLTNSAGDGWRWDATGLGYIMALGSTMLASGYENYGPTHYRAVISLANRDYQIGETKSYRSFVTVHGETVQEDNAPYHVPLYLGRSRTDIILRLDLGPPVATLWDAMFPLVAPENLAAPTLLTFTVTIRPLRVSDEVGVPLHGADVWVTPEDGFPAAARVNELLLALSADKEPVGTAAALLVDHLAEDPHGTTAEEKSDISTARNHADQDHAPATAEANPAAASQAEVEAGTESELRSLSPLRIWQAVTAKIAGAFVNKAALDKIAEASGSPTWNGGPWPGGAPRRLIAAQSLTGLSTIEVSGLNGKAYAWEIFTPAGTTSNTVLQCTFGTPLGGPDYSDNHWSATAQYGTPTGSTGRPTVGQQSGSADQWGSVSAGEVRIINSKPVYQSKYHFRGTALGAVYEYHGARNAVMSSLEKLTFWCNSGTSTFTAGTMLYLYEVTADA